MKPRKLSASQILKWADEHKRRNKSLPRKSSGVITSNAGSAKGLVLTPGQKAAKTRSERFDNATPGVKASITRKRREAARKAWETRRANGE